MATALQSFRLTARSCQCRPHAQRYLTRSIGRRRAFSVARPLREEDGDDFSPTSRGRGRGDRISLAELRALSDKIELARREQGPVSLYERPVPKLDDETKADITYDEEFRQEARVEFIEGTKEAGFPIPQETPTIRQKKLKNTFLNMGDPEPFEDEDFEVESDTFEDMSTLAHGELEHHREMRHYARLAAWEMPLLSKFAKPFEPPTVDMPLRFRYTTYMGEQHPAEKKVVVEFCTLDMRDLTPVQRSKLRKLAGVRYNPETDIVRMSCEMFPSQAQNKRYLGDLINDMLREAKDSTDTFEDVPLDLRHHRFKPKPKFPAGWAMTRERRAELDKLRENAALRDQRRLLTGQLVDGVKQIQEAFAKAPAQPVALPEMAMAGGKGRGKRVAVKR